MTTKWDGRIDKIEEKMGEVGKLPLSARGPFIAWPDPGVKADFSGIENELMRKYGTIEGAECFAIRWGKPEGPPESIKKA